MICSIIKDFIIPLLVPVIASFTTAIFLRKNDNHNRDKDNKQQTANIARALHSEIETLMNIYKRLELNQEPPKNGTDIKIASIQHNYLTVYENNLDKIGLFNTDDIQKIIELYTYIKALLDSHLHVADFWERYAQYTRSENKNKKELEMRLNDVTVTHQFAYEYQKKVYELYPNVLEILKQYWQNK